ncbi:MAG: hypothetical protein WC557_08035 [Ignavibacteriaceae bacterium]
MQRYSIEAQISGAESRPIIPPSSSFNQSKMLVPYQYKFAHPFLAKFLFPNLLAQRYFFYRNLFYDALIEKVLLVVFPVLIH